jgi:hypothetical protein
MTVNVTGNLSATASGTNITNLTDLIEILDAVDFGSSSYVDITVRLESCVFRGGSVGGGAADGVTNPVIVYCTKAVNNNWMTASNIRFLDGTTVIKNASFIFTNSPFTSNSGSGFGGDTISGEVYGECSLENVNIICDDGSSATHYIKPINLKNIYIRNCKSFAFLQNPLSSEGITIVNSIEGLTARNANITLSTTSSPAARLVNANSQFTFVDCRIYERLFFGVETSLTDNLFTFKKTIIHKLNANNSGVKITLLDKDDTVIYDEITDSNGIIDNQIVTTGTISRQSAGVLINSAFQLADLQNSNFVSLPLPFTWLLYSYTTVKQVSTLSAVDFRDGDNLLPIRIENIISTDSAITETNTTTVAAYTNLETTDKVYDSLKLYNTENATQARYPNYENQLVTATGTSLDFGALNLVVDATASDVRSYNPGTSTVTIKATTLTGTTKFNSIKTTGTITSINDALITIPYQDTNGLRFRFYGLPTTGNPRIRVERVSNGTFQYATANNLGEAFLFLVPNEAYKIRADAYLYYRSQDIEFNTSEVNQLQITLDPVKDKDGSILTSLNWVQGEVDCIVFDYNTLTIAVSYDADNPIINIDSLIYAVEKFQSGQNASITGSTDNGLAINNPIRFENGEIVFANITTVKIKAADTNLVTELPYVRATIKHQGYEDIGRLLDTSNGKPLLFASGQVIAVSGSGGGGGSAPSVADIWAHTNRTLTALPGTIAADVTEIKTDVNNLVVPTAVENAEAVRTELETELGRIDANISTRLPTTSYTAPDNANITAIKAKTDLIPADPARQSDFTTIPANIFAYQIDGYTFTQLNRLYSAVLGGKVTNDLESNVITFRNLLDSKNAISATVNVSGDRTNFTYNLT